MNLRIVVLFNSSQPLLCSVLSQQNKRQLEPTNAETLGQWWATCGPSPLFVWPFLFFQQLKGLCLFLRAVSLKAWMRLFQRNMRIFKSRTYF